MNHKSAFSLIELLVVVALLGGLSAAISRIFFSQLKGTEKSQRLIEIRQAGDQALLTIKKKIKNAREVVDSNTVCNGLSRSAISLISRNPAAAGFASAKSITTTFACEVNSGVNRIKIAEVENDTGTIIIDSYISPSTLNIVNCSQIFVCQKTVGNPAKVSINFNLENQSSRDNYDFTSTVSLRNF